MVRVTVPEDYVANTVTSFQEIVDADYATEPTDRIANCPFVPPGSTASLRGGAQEDTELRRCWVDGEVVSYFTFHEAALAMNGDNVPVSPIYVTFNDTAVGPASGFPVETDTDQTHNVAATLPTDDAYSPLWEVHVYDNAEFDAVSDLTSAMDATELDPAATLVNCPIVDF
jgi:hypothetical protein